MITSLIAVSVAVGLGVLLTTAVRRRRRRAIEAAAQSRARRGGHDVRQPVETPAVGGPFLHWVPDHGGWRLAGDFLPTPDRAERDTASLASTGSLVSAAGRRLRRRGR